MWIANKYLLQVSESIVPTRINCCSGIKLRWMLDNVPAVRKACEAGTALFGTVDTWIIWVCSTGNNASLICSFCLELDRGSTCNRCYKRKPYYDDEYQNSPMG